jgi:hypothetical protein
MQRLAALSCYWLLAVLSPAAGRASACTVCDGGTGRQVRARILDGDFGTNLIATLLPFALLAGVVAAIHFGWPAAKDRAPGATKDVNGD